MRKEYRNIDVIVITGGSDVKVAVEMNCIRGEI